MTGPLRASSKIAVKQSTKHVETARQKILLVNLFHPELVRGGAQQACYELFRGLQERSDVEVTLLTSTAPYQLCSRAARGSPDSTVARTSSCF
jgi:hypothetical protein